MAFVMKCHSQPRHSFTVMQIQIIVNTVKNCQVRLTTHCIVTETGGVYCLPFGCSMLKTDQVMAATPR